MTTPLAPLLLQGDCLVELARIPDNSVDAIVTDPPYGLANTDPAHVVEALTRWASGDRAFIPTGRGFMGKAWDAFVPPPAVWDEALRVLKPGGHLLAFAGSRTFDLMTLSIRFAGFDIRDSIAWLYGSGFPKSMDVSKAIDKAAGATREVVGMKDNKGRVKAEGWGMRDADEGDPLTTPATDVAREWEGWGTALKPAFEPIVVARKPLGEKIVAANVLAHGTGALNIDATRIAGQAAAGTGGARRVKVSGDERTDTGAGLYAAGEGAGFEPHTSGRWPANVILDESQAAALDAQTGVKMSRGHTPKSRKGAAADAVYGLKHAGQETVIETHAEESGGASRFFYIAKAPKSERPVVDGTAHPTVKPLSLMRWLTRLVTPPGGCVVDPFAGSGTTLEAAYLEGFESIGVEMTPDYWPLIAARIERVTK